jgi:hypothetical protein
MHHKPISLHSYPTLSVASALAKVNVAAIQLGHVDVAAEALSSATANTGLAQSVSKAMASSVTSNTVQAVPVCKAFAEAKAKAAASGGNASAFAEASAGAGC